MNRVVLVGRLTRDPELRTSSSGVPFVSFSIAINRTFTSNTGEREVDFINCVAFNRQAENLARFIRKGGLIGVEGRLQSNNYTAQDGSKRTTMNVTCDNIQFLEPKSAGSRSGETSFEPRSEQGSLYDYSPYDEMPASNQKTQKPVRQQHEYSPYDEMPKQNYRNQRSTTSHDDGFDDSNNEFNISDDDLPF